MTVWSMIQVEQARGVRAAAEVSREVLKRARTDVMAAIKSRLAQQMKHSAHPFAIEIDPGDLRFRNVEPEREWEPIKVVCWWEPRTREVELIGGEIDGAVYEIRGAPHEPLMMAQQHPINWAQKMDELSPISPLPRTLRFECSGWNESARRWVYAQAN